MPTSNFNATRGCYIDANDTDKHYSSDDLYVKSSVARRGLLEFDVSSLPTGVTVDSATLSLKLIGFFGTNPAGRTYHLRRLTRTDWVTTANANPANGGATWSHADYSTAAWTTPGGDHSTTGQVSFVVPAVGSRVDISVGALVADAKANRNGILSLLILDPTSGTNHQAVLGGPGSVVVADRPTLAVVYSTTGGGSLATPVLSAPADGASVESGANVTFDWSDVAGADLYRLEITEQADTNWASLWLQKHPWPSTWTNPAPPVGDYKWRVQARADNGANVSAYSSVRQFGVAPPPTSSGVIYGAAMTPHTQSRWGQVTNLLGPLTMPRGFKSSMPSSYSNGEWSWHPNVPGVKGLISVKPDVNATINGSNHNLIRDFAATVPDGTWITAWHEPENDDPLQGGVFVDMLQAFYNAIKDGNPTLQVGYAAMAYQWGTESDRNVRNATLAADWTPTKNFIDWVGADVYSYNWSGPNESLYEHQDFQRWYSFFDDFTGKIGIIERGISQYATGGTRANVLERDLQFVAEHDLAVYLYWNADANAGRPEVWVLDNDPEAAAVLEAAAQAA